MEFVNRIDKQKRLKEVLNAGKSMLQLYTNGDNGEINTHNKGA